MQGGILLSPKEVSFREKPSPGRHFVPKWLRFSGGNALGVRGEILLSPKEVSFREEPSPGRHFIPEWLRFPGGNALGVLREILLSPKEVSFREKLTPGGTLSPKGNGFREEMPSWCRGRYFCPRMAAVIGRTRILPGPFWHPAAGDLHCWGNFFCGTDAFIEKNSYFWSNFTENILKHFLILMYFTVG